MILIDFDSDSDSDREATLADTVRVQSEVGAAPSTVNRDIPQVGAQFNSRADDQMASGLAGSVPSVNPPTILIKLSLLRVEICRLWFDSSFKVAIEIKFQRVWQCDGRKTEESSIEERTRQQEKDDEIGGNDAATVGSESKSDSDKE
ncbi:hypothetical protein Q3G72_006953 [Acer saccharum]|nr:hypothetical protein Q3G72_006953 [Acer saccharum]